MYALVMRDTVTISNRGGQRVYVLADTGTIRVNGKNASRIAIFVIVGIGLALLGGACAMGKHAADFLIPDAGKHIDWFEWVFNQFMAGILSVFLLIFGGLGLVMTLAPLSILIPKTDSEIFLDATGLTRARGPEKFRRFDFYPFETIADVQVRSGCISLYLKGDDKPVPVDLIKGMSEEESAAILKLMRDDYDRATAERMAQGI